MDKIESITYNCLDSHNSMEWDGILYIETAEHARLLHTTYVGDVIILWNCNAMHASNDPDVAICGQMEGLDEQWKIVKKFYTIDDIWTALAWVKEELI